MRRCGEGTGDPLLLARIVNLTAVLRGDESRFAEALALCDQAYDLYAAMGERHLAGRALVGKGIQVGREDPESAISLLRQSLSLVDPESDPKLTLMTVHSMADLLTACGRFHEARKLLWRSGLRTLKVDRLWRFKVRWVEAKIDAGLGWLERSEATLGEVYAAFGRESLPYKQALAALDLATVRVQLGKMGEVEPMVEEMVAVFSVLGARREALAALRLLA